jgi:glycine/D-amino acid oxidase-like deaminating enzyme
MSADERFAGVSPIPFWLDDPARPAARPALDHDVDTDLLVVGGGFTGLWTALLAKRADPGRAVALVEADRIGWAASGRNGGFCEASLTHGAANGRRRFADEFDTLQRLGDENLRDLCADLDRHHIDASLERTGALSVATEQHQVEWLREEAALGDGEFLGAEAVRAEVASPTYHAGLWDRRSTVMVNPARLAWGLARAAEDMGVEIWENTSAGGFDVTRLPGRSSGPVDVTVGASGSHQVRAGQVVLATNVFPSLLRRVRPYVIPVYDYAIVTHPLRDDQVAAIGWARRQGIGDCGNQFHYYRLTADNRILFGGYDAVYHLGKAIRSQYDARPATFELLARHLDETFPQIAGIGLSHAWGGAIDLCGRFCAFFGTAKRGRVAYAAGYTGLGVGASRFGAQVMLDLLAGDETERTRTTMVRTTPTPFLPEPLTFIGVAITRRSLAAADRNQGRRNLWLRTLDAIGLGFDS